MSKNIERRISASHIEVRQADDGTVTIRGKAAVYDYEAYGEVIRSSAFTKTLNESADVRLLVNHEGVPLARTKSGTLRLTSDGEALWIEADLDPTNPTAIELLSALGRRDIDQMSFAMQVVKEIRDADGIRNILEAKLFDVSVVTFPWYDATSAELLSASAVELCLRSLSPEDRAGVLANIADVAGDRRAAPPGAMSFGDLAVKVCNAIEALYSTLGVEDVYLWLDDIGTDWAVFYFGGSYMQVGWVVADDGAVSLVGEPFPVDRIVEYRPTPVEDPQMEAARAADRLLEARRLLGIDPAT